MLLGLGLVSSIWGFPIRVWGLGILGVWSLEVLRSKGFGFRFWGLRFKSRGFRRVTKAFEQQTCRKQGRVNYVLLVRGSLLTVSRGLLDQGR